MEQIYLDNLEQYIKGVLQKDFTNFLDIQGLNEKISKTKVNLNITGDEHTHLKALRTKVGQSVLVTNGKGLSSVCKTLEFSKNNHTLEITELLINHNELKTKITLCLGILDNKDRLEFAIEKATELGVSDILLLETQFSEKTKIKTERLNSKLIAAVKQSKRSILPRLEVITFDDILIEFKEKNQKDTLFLLTDIDSKYFNLEEKVNNSKNIVIFVGPEGGFSEKEIENIKDLGSELDNIHILKLSNTRLRAETAAVSSVSVVTNYLV